MILNDNTKHLCSTEVCWMDECRQTDCGKMSKLVRDVEQQKNSKEQQCREQLSNEEVETRESENGLMCSFIAQIVTSYSEKDLES